MKEGTNICPACKGSGYITNCGPIVSMDKRLLCSMCLGSGRVEVKYKITPFKEPQIVGALRLGVDINKADK